MASRVLPPAVTVLKISEGDTLTVRRRLNAGEQRAMFARRYRTNPDGTLTVDPLTIGISTILAYLVDWSLTDLQGNLIVINGQPDEVVMAALDSLDPDAYAEIRKAIEAHEDAMAAEREAAKKKTAPGTETPGAILPSPVVAAGVSSGSVN